MRRGRHVGGRGGSRVPSLLSELEAPPTSQGQVNSTRRDPPQDTTRRDALPAPLDDDDEVFDLIGAIVTRTSTSDDPPDDRCVRAPDEMRDR